MQYSDVADRKPKTVKENTSNLRVKGKAVPL
jgi:hypothetical protein